MLFTLNRIISRHVTLFKLLKILSDYRTALEKYLTMDSPAVYRALKGLFCVYKPSQKTMARTIRDLKTNILKDINEMKGRPMKQNVILHDENLGTDLPVTTTVPDLTDHPLVLGPRYLPEDIYMNRADDPSTYMSGVVVMNINGGKSILRQVKESGHIKVYHVRGEFGIATLDFTPDGKVVEKTTFRHVSQEKLDFILAAIQSAHQRYMYQVCGVDLQSQEAYELAVQGLVRPKVDDSNPMIYGIKCVEFKPPDFTLEVHCVNETCKYLMKLIHDIALELRTSAVCTQLRRIRYGHFTLTHALVRNQWKALSVVENIKLCKRLVTPEKLISEGNIIQSNIIQSGSLIESGEQQKRLVHGPAQHGKTINLVKDLKNSNFDKKSFKKNNSNAV